MEEAIRVVAESSQVRITWALSIIGGSIAIVLGTSYLRPQAIKYRLVYLLFIPGWALLGASIYFGDLVSRRYIAVRFVAESNIREIAREINADYLAQQGTLLVAIGVFLVWLVAYLVWWIFYRPDG